MKTLNLPAGQVEKVRQEERTFPESVTTPGPSSLSRTPPLPQPHRGEQVGLRGSPRGGAGQRRRGNWV